MRKLPAELDMSTNPGLTVQEATAVEEWIESLPEKDTNALIRDQLVLLNAIHQSLVHLQRSQLKMLDALEELSDLQTEEAQVRVSDFDLPFASMVLLLIKWILAIIPAALILAFVAGLVLAGLRLLGWIPPIFGF